MESIEITGASTAIVNACATQSANQRGDDATSRNFSLIRRVIRSSLIKIHRTISEDQLHSKWALWLFQKAVLPSFIKNSNVIPPTDVANSFLKCVKQVPEIGYQYFPAGFCHLTLMNFPT